MPGCCLRAVFALAAFFALPLFTLAQNAEKGSQDPPQLDTSRGDAMIADYFRRETGKLRDACLAYIQTADDWNARKDEYRRQLREMLGLDPLPEKTDLKATITGKLEHEEFTVEKLHFQSRPGLYVTGNLYIPKASGGRQKASGGREPPDGQSTPSVQDQGADAPRSPIEKYPAILYVCGHGNVKKDGVSYGSKSHYQHHGAWFARNGYVCLVIDTLQLGEIEGIHHGTYRYNMWWWLSRGYTPAGVEAWNCVRALDYLQSRPEVDPEKLGVTGRSGGGAYSWWIAAIDERIKCAVPVAGITDLQNHVVDGCVEGHCDCMYMVNTYRWDYSQVAALVAPRPLLISNTDSDGIFPLDGVVRVFDKARRIYTLLGKRDQIGLNITSGGHKDTQELQVTAMRWFNHHLKGYDGPVTNHAEKFFEPEQLKVFDKLPEDQINTKIHETFVAAAAPPKVPESKEEWEKMREGWMRQLREKCFRGWPSDPPPLDVKLVREIERDGLRLREIEFTSDAGIRLCMYCLSRSDVDDPRIASLEIMDQKGFSQTEAALKGLFHKDEGVPSKKSPFSAALEQVLKFGVAKGSVATVFVAPRGVGQTVWDQSDKKQVQNRRRFALLGQSLESCQIWDLCRAIRATDEIDSLKNSRIFVVGHGDMAGLAACASLLETSVEYLMINPKNPREMGAVAIPNLGRIIDMQALIAMVAERSAVTIQQGTDFDWDFTTSVSKTLRWKREQFQIEAGIPALPK